MSESTAPVNDVAPVDEPVSEAQRKMESNVQEMLKRGYVEVSEINDLKVGARVRHQGQQWSGAYRNGTGVIERIFHKPSSSWSQKRNRQDIELIVKRDTPVLGLDYGYWADYHTALVTDNE